MFSDKIFQIALMISLITHGVILLQQPNFLLYSQQKIQNNNNLEVSYLKPVQKHNIRIEKKKNNVDYDFLLKSPSIITPNKTTLPPIINKEEIFKRDKEVSLQKISFTKPESLKPDIIAVKKKITLSPTNLDKIDSPFYVAHSQIVREKIKRALYQNYNRMEEGQIYLSFVLSSDGYLKDVRLLEEKSSVSSYLRSIALESIKDASPFPSFPKGLDYDQLTFNVIISFEIE
jgi:TonB family protein